MLLGNLDEKEENDSDNLKEIQGPKPKRRTLLTCIKQKAYIWFEAAGS